MRIKIKSRYQRLYDRTAYLNNWHSYFALSPVRLDTYTVAWLEWVVRRSRDDDRRGPWKYRGNAEFIAEKLKEKKDY